MHPFSKSGFEIPLGERSGCEVPLVTHVGKRLFQGPQKVKSSSFLDANSVVAVRTSLTKSGSLCSFTKKGNMHVDDGRIDGMLAEYLMHSPM